MEFEGRYAFEKGTFAVRRVARGYEGELINETADKAFVLTNLHEQGGKLVGTAGSTVWTFDKAEAADGTNTYAVTYTEARRRALILYATMTRNTERVANWFREQLEYYKWEVVMFRLSKMTDWAGIQKDVYFDDYDLVLLGSPIVAGFPLTIINKVFSLGAGGALEDNVTKQVESGSGFQMGADTMGGGVGGVSGASGDAPSPEKKQVGAHWRRHGCPYPGGPSRNNYQPYGVVFTTYGGGFYGPAEATATLEILKLYLDLNDVKTVGTFSCCGREFGPAGLKPGEKPHCFDGTEMPEAKVYELSDGTTLQSGYFHHAQMWNKPFGRDEMKAKALIADIVEDVFCTYDGVRYDVVTGYSSIS